MIQLSGYIDEQHRLQVELPPETPIGAVIITIQAQIDQPAPNTATQVARAKLLAGGMLLANHQAPPDVVALSPEALLQMGQLAPHAPSSLDLINEDRGDF